MASYTYGKNDKFRKLWRGARPVAKGRVYVELEVRVRDRQVWFENEVGLGHDQAVLEQLALEHVDAMEHMLAG